MGKKFCVVCGKEIVNGEFDEFCSESCFEQDFWTKALDDSAVIIDGTCYHVDDENEKSYFRGFGGARFVIEFNDGRRITTTNLWYQGKIPKKFIKEDNAKFVKL